MFSDGDQMSASNTWKLISVGFFVNGLPTATEKSDNGVEGVAAHRGNSYACDAMMDFKLTGDLNVTVSTVDLRIQPYMTSESDGFGLMERCDADKITNNVVPIAVGAALAALVVIVLIMYLIGRRKHQRGYQTV